MFLTPHRYYREVGQIRKRPPVPLQEADDRNPPPLGIATYGSRGTAMFGHSKTQYRSSTRKMARTPERRPSTGMRSSAP